MQKTQVRDKSKPAHLGPGRPRKTDVTKVNLPKVTFQHPKGHPLGQDSFEEIYQKTLAQAKVLTPNSITARNPELAAQVLWLTLQGQSRLGIARDLNLSAHNVRSILESNTQTIEEKRKEMAHVYAGVANQYVGLLQKKADLLEDDDAALKNTPPDKLAVVVGIMTDHHTKLSGMNTITIEHRKGATIDEAQATLAAIRARIAENAKSIAIEAEVVRDETN